MSARLAKWGVAAASLLGLALLVGCAAYKLGPPEAALPYQSLYIPPIENRAVAPEVVEPLTRALRAEVACDPRLRLARDASDADATLLLRLTDYRRERVAVQPEDTQAGQAFALILRAEAQVVDRSGKVLSRADDLEAEMVNSVGMLPETEYINLPVLAEQLARKVRARVLTAW